MYTLYLLLSKIPAEVYQCVSGREQLQGQAVLQMGRQPTIAVSLLLLHFYRDVLCGRTSTGLYSRVVSVKNPNEQCMSDCGLFALTTSEYNPVQSAFYDMSFLLHVTREFSLK